MFLVFFPPILKPQGFFSRYCSALCFIFCQVVIKESPDIYSSFYSSTECLNLSHHITFVRASLACGGGIDTGPGNIQPMSLEKKTNCDLVQHQTFSLLLTCKGS